MPGLELRRGGQHLGPGSRALRQQGLDEGISTRMLIYAGILIRDGVAPRDSCEMTLTRALTDDPDLLAALRQQIKQALMDAFYVDTDEWRAQIVAQAMESMHQAVSGLNA